MQKLGRVALFLVAALLILFVALLIGLNLYVQSQGTQARLEQEVQDRLGTPLKIQGISVTPWAGLKLTGISIPEATNGPHNHFEAKSLRLRVAFLSLFSHRLVIKQISLADANVVWAQNSAGKWRLPDATETPPSDVPVAQPDMTPEVAGAPPQSQNVPAENLKLANHPEKKVRFVPEIRHVNLNRADFRFVDRSGNLVAGFENVGFRSTIHDGADLHGNARVGKASVRDRFFLESFRSPVDYDGTRLVLPQILAHLAGGDVSGKFSIEPETADSPFDVELKFRNVDADRVISDAGGQTGVLQGKLDGSLQAAGRTADQNALTGTGEISLRDGQVRQYSLFVALGQIFQIEELTQLHLQQAEAKYHIEPGVVQIDQLILQSPNIHLAGSGTVTFGGKLHLDSRLAINEKVRSQLFKPIRANFQPTEEPGYYAIDFQVGGTIERPKTNLLERVVGRDLQDLVNSLWSGKTSRGKKKKEIEGNLSPSPSPETATTPQTPSAAMTPPGPP